MQKGHNRGFGRLVNFTANKSVLSVSSALSAVQTNSTAVYKARALYAMYAPASMFDDIKICNAVGVYKNGGGNDEPQKGIFDDENVFLKGGQTNGAASFPLIAETYSL